jgi:hypothetical protein
MPRYFTLICGHQYTDKNQLHTTLKRVGKEYSNELLESNEAKEEFIEALDYSVAEAHHEHPKCNPLLLKVLRENDTDRASFPDGNFEIAVYVPGVFHIHIYKINE